MCFLSYNNISYCYYMYFTVETDQADTNNDSLTLALLRPIPHKFCAF